MSKENSFKWEKISTDKKQMSAESKREFFVPSVDMSGCHPC
jgi:hypothetical protein